jgi:GrpB-like predicted nucleotidyltransferase (UPF0157 family)
VGRDRQEDQLSVQLVAHRPEWADEFEDVAARLRQALGPLAVRIDHIGSTSVPGLPAKDVIDLQVIVASLDGLDEPFGRAGFEPRLGGVVRDHVPEGWEGDEGAWTKRLYGSPADERRVNAHVRLLGSPNERYALLFRDYLRAHDDVRDRWAETKRSIAATAQDIDSYLDVKDPLTDVLMRDAEKWAEETGWRVSH